MDLFYHLLYVVASLLCLSSPTDSLPLCCFLLVSPSSRRINIGQKYQAEIPELRDRLSSQLDHHRADLVWLPMDDSHLSASEQQRSERRYRVSSHSHTLCCYFPLDLLLLSLSLSLFDEFSQTISLFPSRQWPTWWAWLVPVCSGGEEPTRNWFYTVYTNVAAIFSWVRLPPRSQPHHSLASGSVVPTGKLLQISWKIAAMITRQRSSTDSRLVSTVQDTLGRLMFQDTLFPGGHHLSGYHYSGDSLLCPRKRNSCLLFGYVVALPVRKWLTLTGLICSQAPSAGRLRKSDTSIRGSRPTERTSSWCRNW